MASIIKVDTIQTAAGGTPTAADLGLNTTGSVINVYEATDTTLHQQSSTSWANVPGLSITLTPTSASSKFLVSAIVEYSTEGASRAFGLRLARDGSSIQDVTDRYAVTASTASFNRAIYPTAKLDSPSTTSSITYTLQVAGSNSDRIHINDNGITESTLQILEIAG